MNKIYRQLAIITMGFFLLSCNLSSALKPAVTAPTSAPVEGTPVPTPEMNADDVDGEDDIDLSPTLATGGELPFEDLFNICSIVTAADVESFLNEPVDEPQNLDGACTFKNIEDGLSNISITAGRDEEGAAIMENQIELLGLAGLDVDDTFRNEAVTLAKQSDYRGFFTKLATQAKGSSSMNARLFAGGGNDISFWAWLTVPPRHQASFVAVRDTTVVNIGLIVPESMQETDLLKECNRFAGIIFERLPEEFSILQDSTEVEPVEELEPTQTAEPSVDDQPAAAQAETLVVPGLPAPILVSPDDGATFDVYPRATTLLWEPVDGAAKYLVEIMACAPTDTDTCFSHPMLEKTTRETIETMYAFNFVGEQTGKWRVIPIDASGELGNPSEWRIFLYTK